MAKAETERRWVEAIRNNPLIGRGSCSPIDECYTDEELLDEIRSLGLTNQAQVLAHFRKAHKLDAEIQGERDAAYGW